MEQTAYLSGNLLFRHVTLFVRRCRSIVSAEISQLQRYPMDDSTYDFFYKNAQVKLHKIDDAAIAVRVYGQGPALILVHGFLVHGYTWRKMLPKLAEKFTCYVLDMPGLGDSVWTAKTDFTFTAQAKRLAQLLGILAIKECSILAQDTGATICRLVAAAEPQKIRKLVIINTEMPGHRPPWIPLYMHLAKLPGANAIFRGVFASPIARTSMGFKGFYYDAQLLNNSLRPYLQPLIKSAKKMHGALGYLKGIEWDVVDNLISTHKNIKADTMIIWGENDKIFPVDIAEKMSKQFNANTHFIKIPKTELMPHEEKPEQVLEYVIPFFLNNKQQ